MNRRKAIYSLMLLGAGTVATYTGYKLYQVNKKPNLMFLDEHVDLIAALTENIIPRTDTPGAIDTGSPAILIAMIKNNADRKTQNNFIDGLKELINYTTSKYDQPFATLPFATQQQIVQVFYEKGKNYAGKSGKVKNKILGKSFFEILKQYTSIAYCTSKEGASIGLAYDYIPGKFEGCVSLSPGQKSWATK
jgi:hypothetical protein